MSKYTIGLIEKELKDIEVTQVITELEERHETM
jgi:hypothetical protein